MYVWYTYFSSIRDYIHGLVSMLCQAPALGINGFKGVMNWLFKFYYIVV